MSGLEQEFPGKLHAVNVDAMSAEAKPVVAALGFKSHGIVLRSADGKELWKQPDHSVNIEDARREIKTRIGG